MKLLLKYLWQYRFTGIIFVVWIGIFTGIFSLYSLELEAIVYAAILSALAAILLMIINFFRFYQRHRALQKMGNEIELLETRVLRPANLMEEDMCGMIEVLQETNHRNMSAWKAERSNSIDYYTTWVHQIKAPIAIMRLQLQSMESTESKELLAELFRIEQYTEMALNYARLDSNSTDLILRSVSLDNILRQAIRKFAPQFIHKKIRLQYDGTNAKVLTDEKWLLFIIEQVLSNAVKYTEQGSVTITVSNEKLLQISDTGIGIAAEDLPRIFEKGFTGYNGHADKKSTGIGLYLCMRAAKLLSHKLSVISKEKEGTTVTIDLSHEALDVA